MNAHQVCIIALPTIRCLMQRVQATQRMLHTSRDEDWNDANSADIQACEELASGLMFATGLTREELRTLGELI